MKPQTEAISCSFLGTGPSLPTLGGEGGSNRAWSSPRKVSEAGVCPQRLMLLPCVSGLVQHHFVPLNPALLFWFPHLGHPFHPCMDSWLSKHLQTAQGLQTPAQTPSGRRLCVLLGSSDSSTASLPQPSKPQASPESAASSLPTAHPNSLSSSKSHHAPS